MLMTTNIRTSATAQWSYTISISSCGPGQGLKIDCIKTSDISENCGFMGDYDIVHPTMKDAKMLLSEKMTNITFVEESTIKELKACLCGLWPLFYSGAYGYTLCNPHFNICGDFTLELESPLDCYGQIVVSGRNDICLPVAQDGMCICACAGMGLSAHDC